MNKNNYIYFKIIIFLCSLNYCISNIIDFDIFTKLLNIISYEFKLVILTIIAIITIIFINNKNEFLPFLTETILPFSLIKDSKIPLDATEKIDIKVSPNSTIMYWAAEKKSKEEILNYKHAYNNYSNSGITKSDNNGIAILKFRKPQRYYITNTFGNKIILRPHINYRFTKYDGKLSKIYTKFL